MINEEIAVDIQDDEEYQAKLSEKLQVFGSRLSTLMADRVSKRSAIEARWLEDLRQYNGKYSADEQARLDASEGSSIFVNITRNKTNAAEARLSDMLFPTDDRNWGIRPTPVPQLESQSKDHQDPEKDNARQLIKLAKDRAEAMTREINDQLVESKYHAICRDMIHDACVMGTGIIKGPVIVGKTNQVWIQNDLGESELHVEDDFSPGTQYVDPWNFYPDDSAATLTESESNLERHYITKRQLIGLAKTPGYLPDQIRSIIQGDVRNTQATHDWQTELRAISGITSSSDNTKYELWEYTGPIEKDELLAAGEEIDEDELVEYYGTVLFCDSTVIRVSIHPMETQDDLYRVFNWEKDRSSIFGFGVPYLMRNPQKVMNAAWRMVLDNGGLSAGPQIVVDTDAIEPLDGVWCIQSRKLWKKKKSGVQVDHAFRVYQIDNNQNELMNIFTSARQLADEETNLPLIAQGEQSSAVTKTARGMDMLMNSANIVLRRAVKNFDDDVTTPHITAYYNWNMQFNDNPEVKGDFTIDARGSGALLAREMQQERLMQFSQIAGSNEEFAVRTDWDGLYKQIVKHMQIAKDDVVLPEEEVQKVLEQRQQQQPQMDPIKQAELQIKQSDLQLKQADMQFNQQLKAQQQAIDKENFERELMQNRELEMGRIASREDLTIAQLQERTGLELNKEQTKRQIAAGNMTLAQSDQILKEKNMRQGFDSYS